MNFLKKVLASLAAAATTPDAIKAEKSLAAIIVFRLLFVLGASDGLIRLAHQLLGL